MTLARKPFTPRVLLATGLLLGVAAAHAASGFTVTHGQESLVTPGMTEAEVQQALGHPTQDIHYRNEPGPTFTYHVDAVEPTLFDVDFSADGKVLSTSERMDESVGGGDSSN